MKMIVARTIGREEKGTGLKTRHYKFEAEKDVRY
jgi:hypothetical protein